MDSNEDSDEIDGQSPEPGPTDEAIFEMSTEVEDTQQPSTILSLPSYRMGKPSSVEQESEDSGQDYAHGLPGTTPPMHGRYMKMAKKGHKHTFSAKKLSMGPVPVKRSIHSAPPKLKRHSKSLGTFPSPPSPPELKEGGQSQVGKSSDHHQKTSEKKQHPHHRKERRRGNSSGSGGGCSSPGQGCEDKPGRKKRKDNTKRRTKDRDEKQGRLPSVRSTEFPLAEASAVATPTSIDVPDMPDIGFLMPTPGSEESFLVTQSLQPHMRLNSASSCGSTTRKFPRANSDIHLSLRSLGGSEERQSIHCPPERKQFYRQFRRALQYSGITSIARNRIETNPASAVGHPGVHVPRQYSENLSLENPYGHMFSQLWLELQAYLSGRGLEEQEKWMFSNADCVDRVLDRVVKFEIPQFDPRRSLSSQFSSVANERDGYESVDQPSHGCLLQSQLSAPLNPVEEEEVHTAEQSTAGSRHPCDVTQQDSVESRSSGDSLHCRCSLKDFLSGIQASAVERVTTLLTELEKVEGFYPNRKRMGDEHPKYRTLVFRRRVEAITLWYKATVGLADRLCALSSFLGVQVVLPDFCREPPESPFRSLSAEGLASCQQESVFASSPKSPKSPRSAAHFCLGSPRHDEGFQQATSSLKKMAFSHRYNSKSTSSSHSCDQPSLQRLFSVSSFDGEHGPYHAFVDHGLKKSSLDRLMKRLVDFIQPVLSIAQFAFTPRPDHDEPDSANAHSYESVPEERVPLLRKFLNPSVVTEYDHYHQRAPQTALDRSTSVQPESWLQEFEEMRLPLFSTQYIQLVHIPVDVMHECLRLQLELRPPREPSAHSVKKLVRECRECLEEAIKTRQCYRDNIEVLTRGDPCQREQVESDLEGFEEDLGSVLEVYFDYLQSWAQVSSGHILEDEWKHVKQICTQIRGGEAEAGRRFCDMASRLLESTADILETRMDECCTVLHKSLESTELKRAVFGESCHSFKVLFVDIRERASKALGFAKMLRKDLEIAADFHIQVSTPELLSVLQASDHVQVVVSNQRNKMIFVPEGTANDTKEILDLLGVSFARHGSGNNFDLKDSYLLLVNISSSDSAASWNGKTVHIKASAETTIAISEIQVDSVKMVVSSSVHLNTCRSSFLSAVGKAVKLTNEQTSSHQNVADRIGDLKRAACDLARNLMSTASQVMDHLSMDGTSNSEDFSKPYQGTMHSCFNLGFEYVREVFRLLGEDMAYQELGDDIMDYGQQWMIFVEERCDRGRGTQPRWATTGLDFLTISCAPRMLASISQTSFEALKKKMNRCLDHIIGEAPPASVRPGPNPTPVYNNRRPWRKPKPAFGTRAFSASFSRVDEEDFSFSRSQFPPSSYQREVADEVVVVKPPLSEAAAKAASPKTSPRLKEPLEAGVTVSYQNFIQPLSPSISGDSLSSGRGSPPAQTDVSTPFTPTNSLRHPKSISSVPSLERLDSHTIERSDSNASSGSASVFYSTFARSPSLGSSDGSECCEVRTKSFREKVKVMEMNREQMLRQRRVIGKVTERQQHSLHETAKLSRLKQAHFKWQRGRKLGEGRFGKVYECLNLDTGESNAVKQIIIQDRDAGSIQTILDEITLFQQLDHPNIVKFYGVEVHRNELYMFMEYCNEGTLWSIAQQGLSEHMIRHYTRDLVKAVYALHEKRIVHRDIKGANIFLSSNGSIKLGDFGLSVQLKNFNKTMPNEIKQQVGTVPYMSPEVILKQDMGRPMDIWSVGLPWSDYENQFQIMFQLGNGKHPPIHRDTLSAEGHDFLSHCFEKEPTMRWKAGRLLNHHFVKVSDTHSSSEDN